MTHTLLARVHTFSEKCDIFLRKHAGVRKMSKNAFNGLVASYIGPYTLHEALYSAEINAMVFVRGWPAFMACPLPFQLAGICCMLPYLKLVATP